MTARTRRPPSAAPQLTKAPDTVRGARAKGGSEPRTCGYRGGRRSSPGPGPILPFPFPPASPSVRSKKRCGTALPTARVAPLGLGPRTRAPAALNSNFACALPARPPPRRIDHAAFRSPRNGASPRPPRHRPRARATPAALARRRRGAVAHASCAGPRTASGVCATVICAVLACARPPRLLRTCA